MKTINFAIIGFGSIAKNHVLAVYDANLRFSLPYKLNISHIVTRRPVDIPLNGVKNVLDIEEVFKEESVDFIDICTPNDSHYEIVKKAVKFGKAIYCEKPLASNYKDALKMTNLVEENNIKNSVALMYRFMPAVRLLKRELKRDTIGDIIDFKIRTYHKSYLSEKKKGTWRTLKASGGGALLDLGIHLIDLIHFTLGDIERVDCNTRIYFRDRNEVDEIAYCNLYLKNGIIGSLEVSRIFAERKQTDDYTIFGTKGSIKIDFTNPYEIEIYKYESNSTEIKSVSTTDKIMKYYSDKRSSLGFFQSSHTASLINFTNLIFDNNSSDISAKFKDALKSQRIIEDAYNQLK
ncbi:hypothetical protein TR13x_06310 [Caloranaerobacter sp. TR13]|uniref:Gfo/Idh/MocA family protein n=1 Tax=Caloranaerobacter sp. TR13 TaxID=1302151 RepID=UPI0006D3D7E0|nr:Gfo/Idh/MocA family oxidoreductase [Caloranaerobacter sp. TR13]KPU27171.1 hypothetical protein TR13x_06310 [Caloranaerobacter sp. TR13]